MGFYKIVRDTYQGSGDAAEDLFFVGVFFGWFFFGTPPIDIDDSVHRKLKIADDLSLPKLHKVLKTPTSTQTRG